MFWGTRTDKCEPQGPIFLLNRNHAIVISMLLLLFLCMIVEMPLLQSSIRLPIFHMLLSKQVELLNNMDYETQRLGIDLTKKYTEINRGEKWALPLTSLSCSYWLELFLLSKQYSIYYHSTAFSEKPSISYLNKLHLLERYISLHRYYIEHVLFES